MESHEEGEDIDMSYEEFLIYSARLGELEDVLAMIEEKVELNTTTDESGNTALRKCFELMWIRHGSCQRAPGGRQGLARQWC